MTGGAGPCAAAPHTCAVSLHRGDKGGAAVYGFLNNIKVFDLTDSSNDVPTSAPLTPPNYIRYLGLLVAIKIALIVIFYLLTFAGVNLKTTSTFVVAPMLAAMIEGQYFARANGVKPSGALCWRFAVLAAVLAVFVEALLAGALFALIPEIGQAVGAMPVAYLFSGGLLAIYFGAYFLAHRFFFPMGARNALNADAAKTKRAAQMSKGGKS